MKPAPPPRPPAPPGPKLAPPAKAGPAIRAKPGGKRPAAQQAPEKKGKGCGASAAALFLVAAGITALLFRLLA